MSKNLTVKAALVALTAAMISIVDENREELYISVGYDFDAEVTGDDFHLEPDANGRFILSLCNDTTYEKVAPSNDFNDAYNYLVNLGNGVFSLHISLFTERKKISFEFLFNELKGTVAKEYISSLRRYFDGITKTIIEDDNDFIFEMDYPG